MASYLTPVQSKYRDNVTQTRPGSNRQGIEAENRCVHRPCNVCPFKIYIYILWDNDKYRSKPRLVEPLVVPVVSDIKRMLYTISRYIGRG